MSRRAPLWGRRFGELTAIKALDTRKSGSVEWLCRCDCGATVVRTAGQLLQAYRNDMISACEECNAELRSGKYHYSVGPQRRAVWRELWEECGTLYSSVAETAWTARVRAAVAREMGFAAREELTPPFEAVPWEPPPTSYDDARITGEGMTYREIGDELGVTPGRAQQLVDRALGKARMAFEAMVCESTNERPRPVLTQEQVKSALWRHRLWQVKKKRALLQQDELRRERELRAQASQERRARAQRIWQSLLG